MASEASKRFVSPASLKNCAVGGPRGERVEWILSILHMKIRARDGREELT